MKTLITEPTCYKNAQNPSLIDLILTNKPKGFHSSMCIETGMSDFHKMTVCVLNVYFMKLCPTKIKYRNYKNFNLNSFKSELKTSLQISEEAEMTYDSFKETFMNSLNKQAPMKEKFIRGNQAPFMNKTLSKAFMQRTKLKNRYNKNPTELNHLHLKKQRNYCVNLLNRVKKEYYTNLDLSIFKDNKTFWKNIRPLFSVKQKVLQGNIILIEDETVISENSAVAEKLNNYFIGIIENLEIEHYNEIMDNEYIGNNNGRKEIETITTKYKNHSSIVKNKGTH